MSEPTPAQDELRINFHPKHLARLAPFIALDDIRYYLCGLRVEPAPKGVYLAATNGHVLAVIHDETGSMTGGSGATVKVTPALVAAARSGAAKYDKTHELMRQRVLVRGKRLLIAPSFDCEGTAVESFVQPGPCIVEGKYPDWRKVLPDFAKLQRGAMFGAESMVQARYLAIAEKIVPKQRQGVILWHDPAAGAEKTVMQFDGVPEMIALLMGMRGEPTEEMRGRLPGLAQPAAAPALPQPDAGVVNRDAVEA